MALPLERARVFFDGIFAQPARLAHPEGVAVDPSDGSVWCGTENGDLLRIEWDGSQMSWHGSTNGWIAGIAFAGDFLFACDIRHRAVFRLDVRTSVLTQFTRVGINIPNYPVVDLRRRRLYVSDSHNFSEPGPGIWSFDLDSGVGELWYAGSLHFANGMALAPDADSLFVVESTAQRVIRIPICANGGPGQVEPVATGLREFPDGLAFDIDGNLYISCYEPSQIYRLSAGGELTMLIRDRFATLLSHPTNMAFRGSEMFTSNLGRWHITRIDVGIQGAAVPTVPGLHTTYNYPVRDCGGVK